MARALPFTSLFRSARVQKVRSILGRASAGAVPSPLARVEPLEERRLMSVTLVTVNLAGNAPGNGPSGESSVSGNGRFVVFSSDATDLVNGDSNAHKDVFIRDVQTNTTTLVSMNSTNAGPGNDDSFEPAVSDNGRFVAFRSLATNLVANDNNGQSDIFIRDLQTSITRLVSATPGGGFGNGFSGEPAISADGRFVAFSSFAGNLVNGDTNSHDDVFVRDTQTNATTIASQSSGGVLGNNTSFDPAISADGRFVTFRSDANNLAPNDNNGVRDVFLRDRTNGTTTLISANPGGASGNKASTSQSVSATGRFVVFRSGANDLTALDTNNADDVFLRDTQSDMTSLLSINQSRTASAHGTSTEPSISQDGHFAAFSSTATDLVASDPNGATNDIFVRDLFAGPITVISQGTGGAAANGPSSDPYVSSNGQFVVFSSTASNLTPSDGNGQQDVFIATTPRPAEDTTPPTAVVSPAQTPPITGGATYDFTIDLTDAVGLNTVSLGNLNVALPGGGTAVATNVGVLGSGTRATATYRIAAPGGTLDPTDDGAYAVTTTSGALKDAAGNGIPAGTSLGSFGLTVCPPNCPDLVPTLLTTLPATVISGKGGTAKVRITNTNPVGMTAKGKIAVRLFLSDDATYSANDLDVGGKNVKLKLKINKGTTQKIKYSYPVSLGNGNFFLIARVDPADVIKEINKVNNTVASTTPVLLAAPFVELSATLALPTGTLVHGKKASTVLTITNHGNQTLNKNVPITFVASTDGVFDANDVVVLPFHKKLKIGAGKNARVKVKVAFPIGLPAGTYFLAAKIDPANTIGDTDVTNNTAVTAGSFTLA